MWGPYADDRAGAVCPWNGPGAVRGDHGGVLGDPDVSPGTRAGIVPAQHKVGVPGH